ncbi:MULTISPECIES: carboxypeptidase-like regulatory domain-containing protein [Acidobacteriaceae]|uniref:carboxypeptidase-like regulatory domain-containing protein n=1 Tax=Acidobacteriaceae TaxID=204434 RepID=UPI00131BF43E|nr:MULTISPECIES: carboxypeptidase-like regulatory domain-containing protein [Acidobacteriaceae]MDW5266621.1 carboxypeptidase-like regulatory domain-containing protein [Edaphobacter sp.]
MHQLTVIRHSSGNSFLSKPLRLALSGIFFTFCLLLAATQPGLGQASSGVTGTVTDSSGAIIPGAAVTVTNIGTGQTAKTTTGSSGTYSTRGLLPGRYTITVTATGFSKEIKNNVNVEVSTEATIDVTLNAGSSDTVIEVTSPLIALNTTQPELGTTIEPEVVQALPFEVSSGRGRQIDSVAFLAPGVQGSTFSKRINGGVDFQSEIVFNGIPAPQPETEGYQTGFNPPFDMVNQARVERSTFSAQYGLAQGAMTYQMASGTNAFHGNAFYINRNEFFDAKGYFNNTTPISRENNYGFTIAGPVVIPHLYNGKDRTFFHFSLDFGKTAVSNNSIGSVPTALEKTGDFSDFVDGTGAVIPIYDPLTHAPFPNNKIPQVRFSSLSTAILPSIPDPDRPGLSSNKTATPNAFPDVAHVWGFVIDHNLTPTQSLHYAQWRNSYDSTGFDNDPIVPVTNELQSAKNNPALGTVFLLNYTNAVTPHLVATAGIGWIGEIGNQFNVKRGVAFSGVTASPISDVFPNITFDGQYQPTNYGTSSGWVQSINRKLGIAVVNNWLWSKGRNTFNIGGEFRRTYQDDNECQACAAQINFSHNTTAAPAGTTAFATTGSSFASFLLGQVDSTQRIFANELKLRNLSLSPYIQDDIKVTPKLTVNVGLRWDIMRPFTENKNQIVYLDPTKQNPAAGNLLGEATQFGSCTGCSGVTHADIHYKHFGPRLGFAYMINDKTVIQGGYSLAFLDGGAYEYGTSKVAVSYGNLLQGSYNRNSTGTNTPGYGEWDGNPIPAPANGVLNPALGIGTTIRAFDPKKDGLAPYIQQWNINVQHQLPWNTFLNVAYIGNRAIHLNGQLNPISQPNPSILALGGPLLTANINDPIAVAAGIQAPYANYASDLGGSATVAHTLSPFPQYSNVYNNYDLSGAANYSGMQASLEKRFSNGLAFLTSYTLAKLMANVDSGFTTFAALPENKFNQKAEWTVDQSDIRNNAKITGTYELPIGPGKSFVNNKGVTGRLLGGLQVGFILSYQSGTPFGVSENDNPLGCSGCFNRPNEVKSVARKTNGYSNLTFANGQSVQKTFSTGSFVSTSQSYTLGDAVRNYSELRNPGNYDEDINARKKFAIGDKVTFILQMDYFNVLNRTYFENPNSNIDNTSNYGLVPSGQQNNARQGQLSGRITF